MNKKIINFCLILCTVVVAVTGLLMHPFHDVTWFCILHACSGVLFCIFCILHVDVAASAKCFRKKKTKTS